jgi:hypothetical protein
MIWGIFRNLNHKVQHLKGFPADVKVNLSQRHKAVDSERVSGFFVAVFPELLRNGIVDNRKIQQHRNHRCHSLRHNYPDSPTIHSVAPTRNSTRPLCRKCSAITEIEINGHPGSPNKHTKNHVPTS